MILFLDFDGVLHPECSGPVPADLAFCRLPLFEAVVREHPSLALVISSTWREQFDLAALRAWFSPDVAKRIVGTTPVLPQPAQREAEILAWLREHGREGCAWLALDDAAWAFTLHRDRLVACRSWIGYDAQADAQLRALLQGHGR